MPTTILGLPLHPLSVHATVVLVPLAALLVLAAAFVPRFRRWAGWLPAAVSVVAVVCTFVSSQSGESLQEAVAGDPGMTLQRAKLIQDHAHLGGLLIWAVLPLAVLAVAMWWLQRERVVLHRVATALGVVAAVATLVLVALIGHSGATAVWCGHAGSSACPSAS